MLLVGEGSLEDIIQKEATMRGLEKYVKFCGIRDDIQNIMQMFDVFVFPSLWEGIPVALIEAQASGLPCIVSDRVSKEVKILESMKFISLSAPIEEWSKQILNALNEERVDEVEQIRRAGFDIAFTIKELQNSFSCMK